MTNWRLVWITAHNVRCEAMVVKPAFSDGWPLHFLSGEMNA